MNEENKQEDILEDTPEKQEIVKQIKKFTILGFSIWRLFAYFIIYSFLGYIIETLFGIVTEGIWESRQSFLYGPFCGIYGIGAIIMILLLQYFKKNNNRLFWGGFLIGSVTEYTLSFLGEKILHVIWWDYSNMPLNINGRICVFFSLFWGFLAVYLMSYMNPLIDKIINWFKNKISIKILKIITITVIILLFIDFVITGVALKLFNARIIHNNDINVANRDKLEKVYEIYSSNENITKFIETFFSDEKIIKTFPNLKTIDVDGKIIYFADYLSDIQTYYYKFDTNLKDSQLISTLKGELSKLNVIPNKDSNMSK